MRRAYKFFLLARLIFAVSVTAQDVRITPNDHLGTPAFVQFQESNRPDFSLWQQVVAKASGNGNATSWQIYNILKDELGQVHYRARQYFNGIPLENGSIVIHTLEGKILSFNGEIIPERLIGGVRQLSTDEAISKALNYLPATTYYWQDEGLNEMLRHASGKPDTSFYPVAKLVYAAKDMLYTQKHLLCWKLDVYASEPLAGKSIFVNAETGEVIASNDLILHTEVTGSAVTKYSNTRAIQTDSTSPGNYRLREKNRGNGIETYNLKKGTNYASGVDFADADNVWNNVNANKDEVATDAHWGAEMTYDYYKNVHSRNSYDGAGAKILSYVHYSTSYNNAYWNGVCMTYGDGDGSTFTPLTALDVCGHEITHAVTSNSANLTYSYESGGLNESFSDVFGQTIEMWARPTKWNWRIGEDITPSGNGIRSMTNPNLFNNPKFYKGNYWYSGAGDNGGVHTNSGVQNYWYYLIANGSTGTNEKGWSFKIDSLGIDKAAKIAYRNLTVYLTSGSQYADARAYSIQAATDLFGTCSKEVINVTNAWWVCGVGNKYDSAYVKADFTGDTLGCFTSNAISFKNLSDNYKTVKWYFGDGGTSTTSNPTHFYGSYAKFSVKLVATGCFKNKSDSVTKVNFVRIDSMPDICNAVLMPKSGIDSVNNRCKGFIYDDGGEGDYGALKTVYLKVRIPGADSIRFRFMVLDYENGFDSLYLYKNAITPANKLGGWTGSTLPFAGAWQTVATSTLWLKQFSDPLVQGKGFKIQFEGIRKPIVVNLGKDSLICLGDSVTLTPAVTGGYAPNFSYLWNTGKTGNKLTVSPSVATTYSVLVTDVCTGKQKSDTIIVSVRQPLKVSLGKDTIICAGKSVKLNAAASGGRSSTWSYHWNNSLLGLPSHTATPSSTTSYQVILTDGCSARPDTAVRKVTVKPALKVTVSAASTLLCINQTANLSANGSGGDTTGYVYTWNNALGTGAAKTKTMTDTLMFRVTLKDGCSVLPASDSVWVYTYPALKLVAPNDTILCRGTSVSLDANASGGKGTGYTFQWSSGETSFGISKTPATPTWYKVTLGDGCSPSVTDSVYIDLMAPLSLTSVNDTTLCDGQSLPLTLAGNGGKSATRTITWSPGSVSGFTPVLSPGTGVTSYTATLSDGCTTTDAVTKFKITKLAPLTASISVTPGAICAGDSVKLKFTFSGGKTSSLSWKLDGSPVSFMSRTDHPAAAHTYTVDLDDGCSIPASASAGVTISPAAQATLSVVPNLVCENTQVLFKYTSPDAAKVEWYFSAKDSGDGTGIDYPKIFGGAGKFTAKARVVTSSGCSAWFDLNDTVTAVPYPVAAFTASPAVTTIENPNISFTDKSKGATAYVWDFGDGKQSLFPGDQNHTYSDTGWFDVTLRVSVAPGCINATSQRVRVKDVYHLFIPTSFTPDGSGLNDVFVPKGRAIASFHMTIYNRWGMKVFESANASQGWTGLDDKGNPWAPGFYPVFIEVLDTDGFRHVEKSTITLLK